MCRRCGAPLHNEVENTRLTVPSALQRRRSGVAVTTPAPPPASSARAASPLAAVEAAARNGPPDTLLPGTGARPDNLLPESKPRVRPQPTARTPRIKRGRRIRPPLPARLWTLARRHWRHVLVVLVVAVALTMSLAAVWPVVFSTQSNASFAPSSAAQEKVAVAVLRTVVGGGRMLYAQRQSFARVTPATLSASAYRVPVVAANTKARSGTVSMGVTSAKVLTLATPADAKRCVFARDEPAGAGTRFVTVRTGTCRASAAPAQGWAKR
jgi:hypothetical protein